MKTNRKKSIILGMPRTFSIYEVLVNRLEQLGFEVIDISYDDDVFKYRNIWDRLVNLYHKTILNNKGYKNKLKFKALGVEVVKRLQAIEDKVDYCLLIRADIYPEEVIDQIKMKTNKMIAYQWDGVNRYPAVKKLVYKFDRFFVFDSKDAEQEDERFIATTNFYFGHLDNIEIKPKPSTFFFVGTFMKVRWQQISDTIQLIIQNNGAPNFYLYTGEKDMAKEYHIDGINFINNPLTYQENINLALQNEIFVDFLVDAHNGLSFRVFEAIGYGRKLITNNKEVMNYDFYHPHNIYVLNHEERTLSEFLNIPYSPINTEILNKYNFDNWIYRILEN
ncbi:hypothetical protein [Sphingobacterium sp. DR205]|uniref:hypothetical protein n=1 Tax=Sphingobacterium sp. DR205 TaxID=2713573 RepID=UPI0013E50DA8|nr:hypothetical protein [Sphingobacterium sp. DR205]QIH36261.1 hypothetical protein G6053_26810 [Sphingobacterium sp. DR205]